MALIKISEPILEKKAEDNQEIVIGIDLGTTNSLVAIIENEKVKFFSDKNNQEVIPSIVNYYNDGSVASVGLRDESKNSVSSIKRLMGKSFSDFNDGNLSFKIEKNSNEKEALKIVIGEKKITPAEVSAEILKHLKNLAENQIKNEVKKSVITVPAYFDEAAKNATKLAANLAGLEVLRLVNEPTAAALAYGLDNASEGIYCVFDLGGGTFDVSILKMQKGVFKVLGVSGNNSLGGDDFDEIIAKYLNVSCIEAKKIKETLTFQNACHVERNETSREFEIRSQTPEILRYSQDDRRKDKDDRKETNIKNFTRQEFENLISDKIDITISLTTNLIDDLELEFEEIKGVILVGGSTRIPLIKEKLAAIFGEAKILDKLDPERIVAAGAAWQAYNLSGNSNNLLLDVLPLSLGIEMMGGIVDKVIHRNSTIPTSMTKEFTTYADNQTGMKLHIVQGEREFAKDCRSLAEFEIKKIPAMKAGLARVAINFKVDADGLLTVSATEKFSGKKQEIIVKPSYGLDEREIKKMLLDSLQNSKKDISERLLAQTIVEANHDIEIIKNDLKNSEIATEEKKLISDKLEILEDLIDKKADREDILQAQEQLVKATENLILQKVNAVLKEKISGKKVDEVL